MATGNSSVLMMVIVIWLAGSLGFAIPTGISAAKRGMNAVGWGILAFLTWLSGLIIFLLFAKPKADEVACAACGERIPRNHMYCPFCGHRETTDLSLKGE